MVSEISTEIVKNVLLGCVCGLCNHQPIHLQLCFSKVQKGKGFWRMRNKLLTDFEYITGCNEVKKDTLSQYSGRLRQLKLSAITSNEQYCNAPYDINYSLLHDVVLMEVQSYTMIYEAIKRRKKNDKKDRLENEIDKIQNTANDEEIKKLEELRKREDKRDTENARRYFAKNNLEGGRPIKFFLFYEQKISK